MKRIHMRVLTACVLLVTAFALFACASSSGNASAPDPARKEQKKAEPLVSSADGLKLDGALCIGIRANATAPFVMESKGNVTGLDMDVACALAAELGLKPSVVKVTDVQEALASTCDVVMNVNADPQQDFDVVGHYNDSATAFFCVGKAGVRSVEEVSHKKLALQEASSAQRALRITNLEVTESSTKTLGDAFDALLDGSVDYVLCNVGAGAYLATRYDGVNFAGTLGEPVANGIALAKGDGALQKAIRKAYKRIQKNGVLAEARRCWLGNLPVLSADSQVPNVPLKETTGESLQSLSAGAETLDTAMDGSSAGANAVSPGNSGPSEEEAPASDAARSELQSVATTQAVNQAPQAEVPQEPTYEEPTYEEPTYEEPSYEEPTYEEDYAAYDDYSNTDYGEYYADYGSNDYLADSNA